MLEEEQLQDGQDTHNCNAKYQETQLEQDKTLNTLEQ